MLLMLAQETGQILLVVAVILAALILFALTIFFFSYGFLWIKALLSGAHVSISDCRR